MVLKITASFVIFLAVLSGLFSATRFVADMQMQIARTAYLNRDIATSYFYAKKAIFFNPVEPKYKENMRVIERKYKELNSILASKRGER